jgi:hypothetical protein
MPNYLPDESSFSTEKLLKEIEKREDVFIPLIINLDYIENILMNNIKKTFTVKYAHGINVKKECQTILNWLKEGSLENDINDRIIEKYYEILKDSMFSLKVDEALKEDDASRANPYD